MITQCDPDLLDTTNTCETDVSDYDSLVPVTDPLTNVHYMSKNCALCNLKNSSAPLLYWKLGIQSNKHMSFPHNQLFEEILRTKGNIFFIPHDYLPIQTCEPASYSIDTCNVTGLWETYDEYVQMACESFVDPFNNTYKNIFCLKCNGEVDLMSEECRYTLDNPTPMMKEPLFAAVLDLPTIRSGFDTTALRCGDAQFRDEITVCLLNLSFSHYIV